MLRGVADYPQTRLLIAFSMMPLRERDRITRVLGCDARLDGFKERVGEVGRYVDRLRRRSIVTNPGAETFQIGALFALGNAILFGTVTVGVRNLASTESPNTLSMHQMTTLTFLYALSLPFGFILPLTWFDAGLMVFNGVTNALGQLWWTRALHLAPTSAVVPFQYPAVFRCQMASRSAMCRRSAC